MADQNMYLSADKFKFVHEGERLHDKKFDDKPIGYFRDAWNRFRKSKASVAAAVIILLIIAYAFIAPLVIERDPTLMDVYYKRNPSRISFLNIPGFMDGGVEKLGTDAVDEASLIRFIGIGIGAMDKDGTGSFTIAEGMEAELQPVKRVDEVIVQELPGKKFKNFYPARVDQYLNVGFIYKDIEQSEYHNIVAWQEETGVQVLYPLVADNDYNPNPKDANYWYKMKTKGQMPVHINANGKAVEQSYSMDLVLESNYEYDSEGNVRFYKPSGGGTLETCQYRVRILYYAYYQYMNGCEPDYLLGTDSQGYDLALRVASGIKLSLLIAICVSAINFVLGAMYGAIAGYYGGTVDLVMERITDILSGVPFIVVATLFQIHLAKDAGPIVCLLFAYVLTGWIGTSSRVRTQFYRFKNQEYVMAARTLGAKDSRIIWKHIFPNTLGTIITSSALAIPGVILSESMLSYLGIINLGSSTTTSLGTLLSEAQGIWTLYPHLMIVPALVISLLMVCFNLFGNGLRDAFNPALRGVEE